MGRRCGVGLPSTFPQHDIIAITTVTLSSEPISRARFVRVRAALAAARSREPCLLNTDSISVCAIWTALKSLITSHRPSLARTTNWSSGESLWLLTSGVADTRGFGLLKSLSPNARDTANAMLNELWVTRQHPARNSTLPPAAMMRALSSGSARVPSICGEQGPVVAEQAQGRASCASPTVEEGHVNGTEGSFEGGLHCRQGGCLAGPLPPP
eukprot:scaffold3884_cov392-Prasinococcus_capsulatus_cf.AAC.3